jgi:hypothetical protein
MIKVAAGCWMLVSTINSLKGDDLISWPLDDLIEQEASIQ